MAIGVLVLGESGSGKTYSIKNFNQDEVKILSVVKPILPFRGKYEIVKTPTGNDIIREMKNTKKKAIVVDDFQYILGLPMMKRIGEKGWDKFSEIQQPYSDVLDAVGDLPDDTIVYFTSHIMRDEDSGKVQIKTIGKALNKYITIEGLFMIVLGTMVSENKYYFVTQNNGANTLKSPEGMFPSLYIPNDLKYVDDKIRNYYYMDGSKTDAEIAEEDAANKREDVKQPGGRRGRKASDTPAETPKPVEAPKTAAEVRASNKEKMNEYMDKVAEAVDSASGGKEEVPFDEASKAIDAVPAPEQEPIPQRTRKTRVIIPAGNTLTEDTYFYIPATDNYVKKHTGDTAPEGGQVIDEQTFGEGIKRIAQEGQQVTAAESAPQTEDATPSRRRRRR